MILVDLAASQCIAIAKHKASNLQCSRVHPFGRANLNCAQTFTLSHWEPVPNRTSLIRYVSKAKKRAALQAYNILIHFLQCRACTTIRFCSWQKKIHKQNEQFNQIWKKSRSVRGTAGRATLFDTAPRCPFPCSWRQPLRMAAGAANLRVSSNGRGAYGRGASAPPPLSGLI